MTPIPQIIHDGSNNHPINPINVGAKNISPGNRPRRVHSGIRPARGLEIYCLHPGLSGIGGIGRDKFSSSPFLLLSNSPPYGIGGEFSNPNSPFTIHHSQFHKKRHHNVKNRDAFWSF
jgi:hypothetical protein